MGFQVVDWHRLFWVFSCLNLHRKCERTVKSRTLINIEGESGLLVQRDSIARSDDTVLRRVKSRGRGTSQPKVRVLGVDDWAWRKRQRYGTKLMDLERLHVIDLLPVRSAESFAHWLGLHPEVEVITHDRSGLYADGGRQGAPSAVQITDRHHLVSNLAEAMEHDLQQLQIDARRQLTQTVDEWTCRITR